MDASVLYAQEGEAGEAKALIDPNALSKNGTISLMSESISRDGDKIAYMLSSAGSDWGTIKFKDIRTGEEHTDVLKHVKFSCLEWSHDGKGVFYNWYPDSNDASADDGTETTSNSNQKLRYHELGTSQSDDPIVLEKPDQPSWLIGIDISICGRYGIVYFSQSCDPKCAVYYIDFSTINYEIKGQLQLEPLFTEFDAAYHYITNENDTFYFITDFEAPLKRLVCFDLKNPAKASWKDILPHDPKLGALLKSHLVTLQVFK
ncbi:hypothetical protein Ciccas_005053 [Cichlidogyrus casuarinus]|uniref:Peptidase S9A N-terminal domain-containing protein n=1 Tax=Cichlidogyrus casuarinus TaxID=1844966 RepID=A0ABD2Q9V2_9PLAT